MTDQTTEATCPYCDATVTVEIPADSVYDGATKTSKNHDHEHESECAMCDGHFYVHYSLN